jgi:hypothetical protein
MEVKQRRPIKDGLLTMPLSPEEAVTLAGTRCRACGEVFLGRRICCENCSAQDMELLAFSRQGTLWSFTIVRHPPPAGYKVPGEFKPFGLGLVELPEGIRVLAPLDCSFDEIAIGMRLNTVVYPLYENDEGQEVMAFKFRPVQGES